MNDAHSETHPFRKPQTKKFGKRVAPVVADPVVEVTEKHSVVKTRKVRLNYDQLKVLLAEKYGFDPIMTYVNYTSAAGTCYSDNVEYVEVEETTHEEAVTSPEVKTGKVGKVKASSPLTVGEDEEWED